jgi:predicted amino acid racemase
MSTPRIEIDLAKISHNARRLKELYGAKGIGLFGVTKAVCGNPAIAAVLVHAGIDTLADSRVDNIVRMRRAGIDAEFLLLRAPGPSQAEAVVTEADISLSSESAVVDLLAAVAAKKSKKHKLILMVELGDLREGLMPEDLLPAVERLHKRRGVVLAGIGTNLACFGGVVPDREKIELLSSLADDIEGRFGIDLEYVSGGNSANYEWFKSTEDVGRVNNLRLGESVYLGRETLRRSPIPGLYTDAFKLIAEVVEAKVKPSKPYGKICQDAFGNVPRFSDDGPMRRALLGLGLQDVAVSGLTPRLDIDIIGASSDYIIVNTKEEALEVGDEVELAVNYAALLSAMTSPYVEKKTVGQKTFELASPAPRERSLHGS